MRFRLDAQHYINDRLLEPGHIIGDETDVPFIDEKGRPMKPSVSMTPLDAEAHEHFKRTFPGAEFPERDPTAKIPLQGTFDKTKVGGAAPNVPPKPNQDPAIATKPIPAKDSK